MEKFKMATGRTYTEAELEDIHARLDRIDDLVERIFAALKDGHERSLSAKGGEVT